MATEPVVVYFDGHLAGSAAAIQILETLRDDTVLGAWALALPFFVPGLRSCLMRNQS
jgi:hypothetical protein